MMQNLPKGFIIPGHARELYKKYSLYIVIFVYSLSTDDSGTKGQRQQIESFALKMQ